MARNKPGGCADNSVAGFRGKDVTAMRTLRSLTGMPVVCRGRRVGRLLQAVLSEDLTRLQGVWVGAGLRGTRWIAAEELQLLGQVAVMSDSPGARRRMTFSPLLRRATATDGTRLGAVTGAEIDEVSLSVTALELSRGLWDDLFSHRLSVHSFTANRETGEIVVDLAGNAREGYSDEGRHGEGPGDRHGDRLGGGDGVRRHELADRETVEPEGQKDRQLDLR